jgi:hypothetical protein
VNYTKSILAEPVKSYWDLSVALGSSGHKKNLGGTPGLCKRESANSDLGKQLFLCQHCLRCASDRSYSPSHIQERALCSRFGCPIPKLYFSPRCLEFPVGSTHICLSEPWGHSPVPCYEKLSIYSLICTISNDGAGVLDPGMFVIAASTVALTMVELQQLEFVTSSLY